jgi:hypothetical protein
MAGAMAALAVIGACQTTGTSQSVAAVVDNDQQE